MKSFIRLCLLLFISTILITSCKKPVPKQTKYIPKNAVFVATLNTKSLQKKLVKNQATIANILKSFTGSDTSVNKTKQEWEDLQSSGIDLDENFYVAVVKKGGEMTAGKGTTITAVGALKDEGKLKAYIKKKAPSSEVIKEKSYSYATIGTDNTVAWANDVVILLSSQKSFSPADMEYDSTRGTYNFKNPVNPANDIKTELQNDFNLKEDESVASIPEFRDLCQEKADATIWVNSSASIGDLPLPLPKLKELFSNSFTAAKVDFEDGKIVLVSKSYYSKAMQDILKKYTGTSVDMGLIERYPSNNINAFGAFSFNPDIINGIVQYLELGGMVDGYLSKTMGGNYTLRDALKAVKGDFAVIVSDIATKTNGDTSGMKRGFIPNVKLVVNIPVGDKVQMNKLMDKLVEMQMLTKAGNQYKLAPAMQRSGYQLSVDDKNLLIASDENLLNQYKSTSGKTVLNKKVLNDLKEKSGIAYVNIESILNGITVKLNTPGNNILPKAKETFKELEAYTDNFNGHYVTGHAELRFKNEKENSLTSLLGFIETVSKNVKKGSFVMDENDDVQADTAETAPPRIAK